MEVMISAIQNFKNLEILVDLHVVRKIYCRQIKDWMWKDLVGAVTEISTASWKGFSA